MQQPNPTIQQRLSDQPVSLHNALTPFLHILPGEIRNQIYNACLQLSDAEAAELRTNPERTHDGDWRYCRFGGNLSRLPRLACRAFSLTQVCRQIRAEFAPLYWQEAEEKGLVISILRLRPFLETFSVSGFPVKNLLVSLKNDPAWGDYAEVEPFGDLSFRMEKEMEGGDGHGENFHGQDEKDNEKMNEESSNSAQELKLKLRFLNQYLNEATSRVAAAINLRCNTQIQVYLKPKAKAQWIDNQMSAASNSGFDRTVRVVIEDDNIDQWMQRVAIPEIERNMKSISVFEFWREQREGKPEPEPKAESADGVKQRIIMSVIHGSNGK